MSFCMKRRIHIIFLVITILQIISTGIRQVSDFLGPLWALILTNFLNIVCCILGFFGAYSRRKSFIIFYVAWSLLWITWNLFILCLYIPGLKLEAYRSAVLSIRTGGFSYWFTRAPGCVPDWTTDSILVVTNCYLDPNLLEGILAGIQILLGLLGCGFGISIVCRPYYEDKGDRRSIRSSNDSFHQPQRTIPAFLSLTRHGNTSNNSLSSRHRNPSSRLNQRGPLSLPKGSVPNGDAGGSHVSTLDDKFRPMTPRKVKRRSARSIHSQRYGVGAPNLPNSGEAPSSSGSGRNSLRSNPSSRRSTNIRNSKRKPIPQHFVSPINRLMQQQLDSETSHDEPRYQLRDQGHVNPVYIGPQSATTFASNTPNGNCRNAPPPRPPSARSSYSNYHPARLPVNSDQHPNPNIFNLNQTLFTNPAFDSSAEYNESMLSSTTVGGVYEDDTSQNPWQFETLGSHNIPPYTARPIGTNHVTPNNLIIHSTTPMTYLADFMLQQPANPRRNEVIPSSSATLAYPLAHSPVSQESFPMWGIAQAQVPTQSPGIQSSSSSGYPPLMSPSHTSTASRLPSSVPPYTHPPLRHQLRLSSQEGINSETVI